MSDFESGIVALGVPYLVHKVVVVVDFLEKLEYVQMTKLMLEDLERL